MRALKLGANAVKGVAMGLLFFTAWQAIAQDAKTPYPNMAPVDQYLMEDREAEISLARSAAPESTARDAEVLVLGRHGYETAIKGKNAFLCMVERSWNAPIDDSDFWNPKLRAPLCLPVPASRGLAVRLYRLYTEGGEAGPAEISRNQGAHRRFLGARGR